MADVFVSYQKRDRARAQRVVAALSAAGYSVWWDDRITPAESWDRMIEREIGAAKVVLVLWTPHSVESEWVRIEANFAKNARPAKLVQIRLEPSDIPMAFSLTQYADVNDADLTPESNDAWRRTLEWVALFAGPPKPAEGAVITASKQERAPAQSASSAPAPRQSQSQSQGVSQRTLLIAGAALAVLVAGGFGVQALMRANDAYVEIAVDEADEAAWRLAQNRHTEWGYSDYLEQYPEGAHAEEAARLRTYLRAAAQERARDPTGAAEAPAQSDGNAAQNSRVDVVSVEGRRLPATECQSRQFVVYHDYDSSSLGPDARTVLDIAVSRARGCTIESIEIVGHTDTSNSAAYAMGLTERQASGVRDYLVSAGLPADRMSTAGYGETQLARPTEDGVREPLNRRTTVNINLR